MPRRYSGDDLLLRCKQEKDMVNDTSVDDTMWFTKLTQAVAEQADLVSETGKEYFEKSVTFVSDGTNILLEPPGIHNVICLTYVVDPTSPTSERRDLRELMAHERSKVASWTGDHAAFFSIVDYQIFLFPPPPAGQTYILSYVYQSPEIQGFIGDQPMYVDVYDGWGMAYITNAVAVMISILLNEDPSAYMAQRDRAAQFLQDSAINRLALANTRREVDTHGLGGSQADDHYDPLSRFW